MNYKTIINAILETLDVGDCFYTADKNVLGDLYALRESKHEAGNTQWEYSFENRGPYWPVSYTITRIA